VYYFSGQAIQHASFLFGDKEAKVKILAETDYKKKKGLGHSVKAFQSWCGKRTLKD